jgi:hypothetical protein
LQQIGLGEVEDGEDGVEASWLSSTGFGQFQWQRVSEASHLSPISSSAKGDDDGESSSKMSVWYSSSRSRIGGVEAVVVVDTLIFVSHGGSDLLIFVSLGGLDLLIFVSLGRWL